MRSVLLFCLLTVSQLCLAQKANTAKKAVDSLHWFYTIDTDKMTSEKTNCASVFSKERINPGFIYKPTKAYLYLLNNDGLNTLWFAVEMGFLGDLGAKTETVTLRFDEEKPHQYTFFFKEGHKKNMMYMELDSVPSVLKKLKKAKRLRMEVTFLRGNTDVAEFDVSGLKWDYKDKVAESEKEDEKPSWKYETDTDKMTSDKIYVARLKSPKKMYFESENTGGSTAQTIVQYSDTVNALAFFVYPAQFEQYKSDSVDVRIRFDDEKPVYYKFIPVTNSPNEIYVAFNTANHLLEKIKKAHKMLVQADYAKNPGVVAEFDVSGLKWFHSGKASPKIENWSYYTNRDEMTSVIKYHCHVNSTNKLNLSYPYDGGSYTTLYVERFDSVNYVAVMISKGNFKKTPSNYVHTRLRFDNEPAQYYWFWVPSSGRKDIVYITYPYADTIIAKLKKTKKLLVQADYTSDNSMVSEFNVSGLKWNHKERIIDTTKSMPITRAKNDDEKSSSSPISIKVNVTTTNAGDDNSSSIFSSDDDSISYSYLDDPNFRKIRDKYIKESYEDSYEKKYKITTKSVPISKLKFLSTDYSTLSIFSVNKHVFIDITGTYGAPLLINPGDKFVFLLNNDSTVECISTEMQQNTLQPSGNFSHEFVFYSGAFKINQLINGVKSCRFYTTSGYVELLPPSNTNLQDMVKAFLGEFQSHKNQMGN